MLIHMVFKINSDTRVKLASTVTDINVPKLVHIQHLFNHKDRAGLGHYGRNILFLPASPPLRISDAAPSWGFSSLFGRRNPRFSSCNGEN